MISPPTTLSLRRHLLLFVTIVFAALLFAACGGDNAAPTLAPTLAPPAPAQEATAANAPDAEATATESTTESAAIAQSADAQGLATPTPDAGRVPAYTFTVINTYPHDPGAYTQGLQFVDGVFYEGTGRYGASSLRHVEIETGAVLQQHDLAQEYFGEGIVVIDDRIYQLTWQEQTAFLYDRDSFDEIERFSYPTEGWGLTYDGSHLIMSDGSSNLYFRDPVTFEELGRVAVTYLGAPLTRLNELEYIDGIVWANVYQSDYIAQIDPETGVVVGIVDLTGILNTVEVTEPVDVLNGIAWDADTRRLFVTGKWWPAVFEITLQQKGWAQ